VIDWATKEAFAFADQNKKRKYVEIKCQLDATEVFIADVCPVCRMLQHPANRTHNPQLHTRPTT